MSTMAFLGGVDLSADLLGKTVRVQHGDGFLQGRLVEIRHGFAADGRTPRTRVKVEIFEGDPDSIVTMTLSRDRQLQVY